MLRVPPWYPCTVETKGGLMKWRAKKIIITSALQPEDVYDKEKFHADDHIAPSCLDGLPVNMCFVNWVCKKIQG